MGDGLAAIVRSRVSALSTVRTVRMYELYSTVVPSSAANLISCPNSGGREHNGRRIGAGLGEDVGVHSTLPSITLSA
jgi:hypothetical protein